VPIETAADFELWLDPAVFGSAFTYSGGSPARLRTLAGIFSKAHAIEAPAGDWPGVSTTAPVLTCRAADLPPGAAAGDSVALDGAAWAVRDIQPDGTGLARLILERA
jgi:hypothetical protein